jgi:hypothetical protein
LNFQNRGQLPVLAIGIKDNRRPPALVRLQPSRNSPRQFFSGALQIPWSAKAPAGPQRVQQIVAVDDDVFGQFPTPAKN